MTLPPVVRRALGLKPGDHIAFVVRGALDPAAQVNAVRDWDTPEDDEAFGTL